MNNQTVVAETCYYRPFGCVW